MARVVTYCGLVLSVAAASAADEPPEVPVYPLSAAVAEDGTVYLVDRKLPGVWRSKPGGFEIHHRASKRFRTPLNAPRCIALDSKGRLLVGDSATREVYRFDAAGKPQPLTTSANPGRPGAIGIPADIALDSKGAIFVSDLESHRVWRIAPEGGEPEVFAEVRGPRGLAVDADDRLWVVSHGDDQLLRFSREGDREVVVGGRPFRFPHEIAFGEDGETFVTDGYDKSLWRIADGAAPARLHTGDPFSNPVGVQRRGEGLLVVDPRTGVFSVTRRGAVTPFDDTPESE